MHRFKTQGGRGDDVCFESEKNTRAGMLWEPIGNEQRMLLQTLRNNIATLDWQGALTYLDQIPKDPGPEWMPVMRAVLQCCCKAVQRQAAESVWQSLPRRDVMSYNMMINLMCHLQDTQQARHLVEQMQAEGIEPTAVTYVSMLKVWSEAGDWEAALREFSELKERKHLENEVNWEVAYLTAMNACARGRQSERARELFEQMKAEPHTRPRHSHFNVLIVAHEGQPEQAQVFFDEMRAHGLTPRPRDWRSLIVCYRRTSFAAARQIYENMKAELGQVTDEDSFSALCYAARLWDTPEGAHWVVEEMRTVGIDPSRPDALPILRRNYMSMAPLLAEAASSSALGAAAGGAPHREAAASSAASSAASAGGAPPQEAAATAATALPALPVGWASAMDPGSGRAYYWRVDDPNGSVTWERPQ